MRRDEGEKRCAVTQGRNVSGHGSGVKTVKSQEKHATQAENDAGGIALEGDADIVLDIKPEHDPVGARVTKSADRLGAGTVHSLELSGRLTVHHGQDELRPYKRGDSDDNGRPHE